MCLTRAQRAQRGFTLLEVLITMALIGIAVGMASFQLSSGTRPYTVKNAVKLLHNQAGLALEEAILQSKELGLRFDIDPDNTDSQDRYRYIWMQYNAELQTWQELEAINGLSPGRLPERLQLDLEVEGLPVILGAKEDKTSLLKSKAQVDSEGNELEQQTPPDIYFLSSGELVQFNLAITDTVPEHRPQYKIVGEMVGKLRLFYPGEEVEGRDDF